MRFLNRVHEDTEMAPLELEMYHQIKNIIGVVRNGPVFHQSRALNNLSRIPHSTNTC